MNIKNALLGVCLLVCSLASQAVVITFDDAGIGGSVDNFYSGTSFTTGDWLVSSGFGQTSQPNFAYSSSGQGTVTVSGGFTGVVSFTYGGFVDSIVNIYDGADGTGNLLASIILAANDVQAFSPASIAFSGTALSIAIVSGAAQFGWDDLTFNEGGRVPEPGSLALFGLALAGLAGLRRRPRG